MGILERIRNLISSDMASLFTDPSAGLWKAFLYLSFLVFAILLFAGHYLPDWSYPFRSMQRLQPEQDRSAPVHEGPLRNI